MYCCTGGKASCMIIDNSFCETGVCAAAVIVNDTDAEAAWKASHMWASNYSCAAVLTRWYLKSRAWAHPSISLCCLQSVCRAKVAAAASSSVGVPQQPTNRQARRLAATACSAKCSSPATTSTGGWWKCPHTFSLSCHIFKFARFVASCSNLLTSELKGINRLSHPAVAILKPFLAGVGCQGGDSLRL
jgi:hypothetical protein